MGYQVLKNTIYKYNYPPDKISGLKLNINTINTQYEIIKLQSLQFMYFS